MYMTKLQIKRQQWKAQGLCQRCGKNQTTGYRCEECQSKRREAKRDWASVKKYNSKAKARRRLKVIKHYSNGDNKCVCCGEPNIRFLTIDHCNNDGGIHRKTIGARRIYQWLINHNFPPGYQILCWNCNCGRAMNGGICPHKDVLAFGNH